MSLVLVLLVVQNTASVQAHFLGFTTEMSLLVLLFLTGAIGFVSGLVLGFLLKKRAYSLSKSNKRIKARINFDEVTKVLIHQANDLISVGSEVNINSTVYQRD